MTKKIFSMFMLATFFIAAFVLNASAQTAVAITGNTSDAENDPGWYFQRDLNNQTQAQFTNQKSSLGNGSLLAGPIGSTPAQKFIAERFLVVPIAEIDSISFDFMIAGNGTSASANQVYLNVYANFASAPDTKFYDCRYAVIANVASTTSFKTLTFDPTQAYPVTTSGTSTGGPCPAIPANMGPGAKLRVYAINLGDTGTGDIGLAAYFDNVVEKLTTGTTIFNLEMSSRECKNDGWMTKIGSNGNLYENQGGCVSDTEKRRVQ